MTGALNGQPGLPLPPYLRKARRRLASAALREWRRQQRLQAAAEAPGDDAQDGGDQDA
jgi:hypothetical protein